MRRQRLSPSLASSDDHQTGRPCLAQQPAMAYFMSCCSDHFIHRVVRLASCAINGPQLEDISEGEWFTVTTQSRVRGRRRDVLTVCLQVGIDGVTVGVVRDRSALSDQEQSKTCVCRTLLSTSVVGAQGYVLRLSVFSRCVVFISRFGSRG